ncbi:MAG TPA: transposase [Rhodothermia bacterium]
MTPQKFVDGVLKSVIRENLKLYRGIFADPGEVTDEYWMRALDLFRSLSRAHQKTLLDIMKQVEVDTVSNLFGILDGSSQISGKLEDFDLIHKGSGVRLNGELQDLLLEKTESE